MSTRGGHKAQPSDLAEHPAYSQGHPPLHVSVHQRSRSCSWTCASHSDPAWGRVGFSSRPSQSRHGVQNKELLSVETVKVCGRVLCISQHLEHYYSFLREILFHHFICGKYVAQLDWMRGQRSHCKWRCYDTVQIQVQSQGPPPHDTGGPKSSGGNPGPSQVGRHTCVNRVVTPSDSHFSRTTLMLVR